MPTTLKATRRFRLKILACMLTPHWMARYGTIIQPEYFERKDEHDIAAILTEYCETYGHPPQDVDDLIDLVGTDEYITICNTILLGRDEWDLQYASDKVVQFAQEQAAKIAILESLPDVEHGNLTTVVERLKDAMKVGQDLEFTGIDLKADIDIWLAESQAERIPTGILHLDIALDGGLAVGELGVFAAPPNYGKSMALINVGHGAMGPISKCNVVHFTLEMGSSVVAKRYAARSVFRFPVRGVDTAEYKDDFLNHADIMLPGNVRIFDVRGNVNVMRSHLDVLIDSGYEPGLIIVDYGDEVDPLHRRGDRYTELGEIFGDLRLLGYDYGCPVWTATQTGRHSVNKEVITMGDLAESFKKAHKADAIVAVCQTIEEERSDQCRLFIAKLRDGKSRAMIRCKYFKEQQAIISTGFHAKTNDDEK